MQQSGSVPADAPEAAMVGLRAKVARGLGWKLLGQGFAQVTSVAVGILLAHLLTPRQFGLAGMALVFTGFAGVFTDLALGPALVQRANIREEDRSTAFWTSLGAGVVLTAIAVGLAPFVADFFSMPAVRPLFYASATIFLLSSLSVTQAALLTREMNFRSLEIRGMVSAIAGAAIAVPLAFAGAGAWTIVGQILFASVVSVILLWRLSPWRPRFVYSFESLRTLGSFGSKTLVSQFLGYLSLNMDNVLVGRYLGSTALGVYAIAYNVMFLPVGRISQPIQQVVFAAFAKLQHDPARLSEAWRRGNQLISALNVPAFVGMAVIAPDFVPVVLGHKWHAAVPVLQLLSLAGVAQSFQTLNWSTVQALGRAGVMLRIRLFSAPLTLAAFAVGLRWGVVGVAGLYAAARFIILTVSTVVTCRTLRFPIARVVRESSLVAVLSLAMAVTVYSARIGFVHGGVSAGLRLPALVAIGSVVYVALVAWRTPDLLGEIRSLVRSR
jgi:O-antigen/teichoic acid export membrane protein